ncbi:MAG: hypothetical protein ACLRFM_02970 [Alphaproteobacteria bacterium]
MQKVSYMGNGETTEFYFNFPYFETGNIVVTMNNGPAPTYNIIGSSGGENADFPFIGGRVVFAVAPRATDSITISRQLPMTRIADYQPFAHIEPTTLNQDLNYLMEVIKDKQDELNDLSAQYADIADKESTATLLARISAIHDEIVAIDAKITALGDVSTLRTDVSTNRDNIATNTGDIATLDTRTDGMIDYVVASQSPTAENNYTWYRKYKSGWVEQGQKQINCPHNSVQTITLPIPMMDNTYVVQTFGVQIDSNGSFGASSTISGNAKNATQILIGQQNSSSSSMNIGWAAFGKSAS